MDWHVQQVDDGNELDAIERAIQKGIDETERPSLVIVRPTLGYGSPKRADSWQAHGNPLGAEEVEATKRNLGWPTTEPFFVPDEAREDLGRCVARGEEFATEWETRFAAYRADHPDLAAAFKQELGYPPGRLLHHEA